MKSVFFISGGTGYIGRNFIKSLLREKNENEVKLLVITRDTKNAEKIFEKIIWEVSKEKGRKPESFQNIQFISWDNALKEAKRYSEDEGKKVVLNLVGESIAQRWTEGAKKRILESRTLNTRKMVEIAGILKPDLFISASATGFYGNTGDKEVDELSPRGEGFLSDVCEKWENEARKSAEMGIKTFILRIGVVIGENSSFIKPLLMPFFVPNPFGKGENFVSWIHIDDLVRIISEIEEGKLPKEKKEKMKSGSNSKPKEQKAKSQGDLITVINAVSPNPVKAREIVKTISNITRKPVIPVPTSAIKVMMGGEFVKESFASQKVKPRFLIENNFKFSYDTIEKALSFLKK